jgi:hypothetical protein
MAIHMTRIDELALITLDRPEALNALSFAQLHDLSRQLDSIATATPAPYWSPAPATVPFRPAPTSRS